MVDFIFCAGMRKRREGLSDAAMLKREYGGIQPCWKVGLFRIRLPFIHFKISPPEVVTGLMNACTSYGALAVLIYFFGSRPCSGLGTGCI